MQRSANLNIQKKKEIQEESEEGRERKIERGGKGKVEEMSGGERKEERKNANHCLETFS